MQTPAQQAERAPGLETCLSKLPQRSRDLIAGRYTEELISGLERRRMSEAAVRKSYIAFVAFPLPGKRITDPMTESDIDLIERYLTDELSLRRKRRRNASTVDRRLSSGPGRISGPPRDAFPRPRQGNYRLAKFLEQAPFSALAAAAAIGLLLGGLMTSAVWAYAVPKSERSHLPVPLIDPGFEETTTPLPAIAPRTLNQWVGDASHDREILLFRRQGSWMLKVGTLDGGRPTRIEQIVDVSHLDLDEDAVVEFSLLLLRRR